MEVKHILFGWPVAFFSSGRVIVEGNTTHFAATHPLKLTLYDPSRDAEITLLPRQDDMVLKEITDDLSGLADDSWCRKNNASCEPKDLTGSPEVVVIDHTNAAAFRVVYSGEGYGPRAQDFHPEVVYIFDFSRETMQHREFRSDVLKRLIGSYSLEDLTQPVVLQRLFVTKAANFR